MGYNEQTINFKLFKNEKQNEEMIVFLKKKSSKMQYIWNSIYIVAY